MTRCAQSGTALLCVIVLFSLALAGTPTLLNFQGILTDASGIPQAGGPFTVTFSIYDDALAMNPALWSETQSVPTDDQGHFNVLLGSVSALSDSVFSGSDRWLGVKVLPDGAELLPRTRIVSGAYAFRAATVDGASGGTINGSIAISNGSLNIDHSDISSGDILKNGTLFMHDHGSNNTFIGSDAGNSMLTGSGNTGCGASALKINTTGTYNTAVGFEALKANLAGEQNTACGWIALGNNSSGSFNTAAGVNALRWNSTGNSNTACGWGALLNNNSGVENTAVGKGSLLVNNSGNSNTANGFNALTNNSIGTENTATGWKALENNSSGNNNLAVGGQSLQDNITGSQNTACGVSALISNTTGDNNTAIGYGANVASGSFTNSTAIGYSALVNASDKIRLGNEAVSVIEGQVAYTFTSDKSQKENFAPVDGEEVLRKLGGLNLTSWNYIGQDPSQFRHYGPIAQDFYAAFGHDGVGTSGTPTTINSGDEAGILMIAVQALEKRNKELEAAVDELKSRLELLESR